MILKPKLRFQRPAVLNLADTANTAHPLFGTSVTVPLLRDLPIEELLVRVKCQVSANAALTLNTAVNPESIMGMLKKVKIFRPAGSQGSAGTVVLDYRGIGLLEFTANEGFNHSDDTLGAIQSTANATMAAGVFFTITFRIPFVSPKVAEPLRSRCVFPAHTFVEDPTLQLDFESSGNIWTNATAGVIQKMAVELVYVRANKNDTQTANILASGGYVPMDLVETSFAIPPGTTNEQSLNVPLAGSALNMQFSLYQGGASITRGVPDAITTMGQESTILLKTNGDTWDSFTWEQLKVINGFRRPRTSPSNSQNPALGFPQAAGSLFDTPASVMRDFLTDGVGSDGDSSYELGSVLPLDYYKSIGGKVEVVFTPSNVATNGHVVYIGMRRLWGDLSRYQALEKTTAASTSGG